MSESLAQSMKPARQGASDMQMLVQVEKWMTAIRELNSEPQNESAFRVRLRPATASAKE
jgi:hypothetical protein